MPGKLAVNLQNVYSRPYDKLYPNAHKLHTTKTVSKRSECVLGI